MLISEGPCPTASLTYSPRSPARVCDGRIHPQRAITHVYSQPTELLLHLPEVVRFRVQAVFSDDLAEPFTQLTEKRQPTVWELLLAYITD